MKELIGTAPLYPTVTKEQIDSVITAIDYHVFPNTTVTICLLTLENGFTVTGESACADPRNFDKFKGEYYALEDAKNKIWRLEGYLLRQRLHESAKLEGEGK